MSNLPRNTILIGDALVRLRELPTASVDTCITSPPYFQLRDYGAAGQLGLEATVTEWVEHLRRVLTEVGRVLKPSGSLWLNLGDSYSRHAKYGAPPKGLLLGPERLLIALAADGWIVRNKVIWSKTNPMPHSVGDRLNATYEFVYFLVRSRSYYFDLDLIREPHRSRGSSRGQKQPERPTGWAGPLAGSQDGLRRARAAGVPGHWLGKNPGDVWRMPGSSYRGAHFATFPESLVHRPLLATCPEATCRACGRPWRSVRGSGQLAAPRPGCTCDAGTWPGVVLDPFFGAGTVGLVAGKHGRDWIGIELNPEYARLADERLTMSRPCSFERASRLLAVAA